MNAIRRVVGPFLKELTADQTEEDTVQDLTNEQVEVSRDAETIRISHSLKRGSGHFS